MMIPKYPDITVKLIGTGGNVVAVLSKMRRALIDHGLPPTEVKDFFREATSGDYGHLLRTCIRWVNVK